MAALPPAEAAQRDEAQQDAKAAADVAALRRDAARLPAAAAVEAARANSDAAAAAVSAQLEQLTQAEGTRHEVRVEDSGTYVSALVETKDALEETTAANKEALKAALVTVVRQHEEVVAATEKLIAAQPAAGHTVPDAPEVLEKHAEYLPKTGYAFFLFFLYFHFHIFNYYFFSFVRRVWCLRCASPPLCYSFTQEEAQGFACEEEREECEEVAEIVCPDILRAHDE